MFGKGRGLSENRGDVDEIKRMPDIDYMENGQQSPSDVWIHFPPVAGVYGSEFIPIICLWGDPSQVVPEAYYTHEYVLMI